MNSDLIQILLNSMQTKCPLCDATFRLKHNMRRHLRKHTDREGKDYLRIILNDL